MSKATEYLNKTVKIKDFHPAYNGAIGTVKDVDDIFSFPLLVLVKLNNGVKHYIRLNYSEVELCPDKPVDSQRMLTGPKSLTIPKELWDGDRKHPRKDAITAYDLAFFKWELEQLPEREGK